MLLPTIPAPMTMTLARSSGATRDLLLHAGAAAPQVVRPVACRAGAPDRRPDPADVSLVGWDLGVDRVEIDALGATIQPCHHVEERGRTVQDAEELDRVGVADADPVERIDQPAPDRPRQEQRRHQTRSADEVLVPGDR